MSLRVVAEYLLKILMDCRIVVDDQDAPVGEVDGIGNHARFLFAV